MCLEIASLCEKENYMPYKVDGHADLEVNFESSKVLCILDDCRQLLDLSIHLLLGAYYPVLMFLLYYSLSCVISVFVSFPLSLNYQFYVF
jgi:hypothetical protein